MIQMSHLGLRIQPLTLHLNLLWVFGLIGLYCKKKLLWCGLSESLIYKVLSDTYGKHRSWFKTSQEQVLSTKVIYLSQKGQRTGIRDKNMR